MEVCPTDVILAPAEHVWRLLTNPHELAQWSGTKLVEGPARAVSAGDRLVFRAAMLHIIFDVLDMQAPRQLTLDDATVRLASAGTRRLSAPRWTPPSD